MHYRENLNIIVMRDKGPRRSFHFRRNRFYLLIVFFCCLPVLCLLLATQCWLLWKDNVMLRSNVERFEADYQAAEARAERLENIESLLREENVPGREHLARNLANDLKSRQVAEAETEEQSPEKADVSLPEGPGHEEFPALDSGIVKVSNVQARALRGNTLRIALDLRNPDNEKVISGEVDATLVTAGGEKHSLVLTPQDVGNFRINRFKRAVMLARPPKNVSLLNSEIIVEVRDSDGKPIYRNIFAVMR